MLFNPSHPGEVLKDYLGDMTVKEAARRPGVTRSNLSRILNGRAGKAAFNRTTFSVASSMLATSRTALHFRSRVGAAVASVTDSCQNTLEPPASDGAG
jgi:hypothetical protein